YALTPDNRLRIVLEGRTDAPTLLNLAQHGYFNLDGAPDVSAHRLTVAADSRTETDAALIPTGRLIGVEGTPHDFRAGRSLGAPDSPPYDTNFVLACERRPDPVFAARLQGGTGVTMELWTTEPGLQLYDACGLDVPVPGLDGRRYGPRAGVCLEPQIWPDAPNHPHFPCAVLRPGETYRQVTELRFNG
ncbi:MAG: galactose mutarotase, partial [Rubrimonas sp.]